MSTDAAATTTTNSTAAAANADAKFSDFYHEKADRFAEFDSFLPNADGAGMGSGMGSERNLSARQLSGMLDKQEEQSKQVEQWDDEDESDTFAALAEKLGLTGKN
jgi:hypothetical protein